MIESKSKSKKSIDLRALAENELKDRTTGFQELPIRDIESLIHELQVHQIELEMQNEELHRSQNELDLALSRYADLYDFAPTGYFTFDKNGLILEVNLTGARMLGVERSFLIKKLISLHVARDSRDVFYLHLQHVFKTEIKQTCELRLVDKKGNQFDARLESLPVHDSEGKFSQCRTVISDITEKKKLESQFLRAQRMESIGTLAGGIAHDLNNLLTPIMLSLQILKQKFTDEQSQKLITLLEQNSHRAAGLIKQVLSFARGIEGERNALQAAYLIYEIEKIVKETFPRDIEIKTNIPKDLWIISGDATQLHQVIMNLCVNARDAMPDGGILSISAENFFIDEDYAQMNLEAKVGSYIIISISDTGTGIPPEILNRIFEPFFTTKDQGKGTGLGLSTSLAIVKSHSGFIDVHSEIGAGTVFKVFLPAIITEVQEAETQKPELPIGYGGLILVVEDEDSIRETTIAMLEGHGYKVLTANDGAEAVALYAQNKEKIELVLMDMMMPVMGGTACIQVLRKINPEVKIIAVSGLADKDELDQIANIHIQAFLPKPYAAERLLKTIHEVLSTK